MSEHKLLVRGPPAKLWTWFAMARDGTGTPPLEAAIWGRAGSGKSWGVLSFFMWLAHEYPKIPGRGLIVRDTRHSITHSACVTLRKLLPDGHPMFEGATDGGRDHFDVGNWQVVLSGMAEPARLYSTEWDWVYFMEARQTEKGPWEEFARGIRNYALYRYNADGEVVRDALGNLMYEGARSVTQIPWGLCVLDTNPDRKGHWIQKRGESGMMAYEQSFIQDNPAYWDLERDCLTPMGEAFEARMNKTGGVRFRRLVLGEWCSAEGAIWGEFDPEVHQIRVKRDAEGWVPREELERLGITSFYAGKDLGFDRPGVLLVAGYTKTRKLIVLAEVYRRGMNLKWWTDRLLEIHAHYPIEMGWADTNKPEWIQEFNDALGVPREGPGAIFRKTPKGKERGLEIVRQRFAVGPGGPMLVFDRECLYGGVDEELMGSGEPWCTVEEIPGYPYKRSSTSDDADETIHRTDEPDKSKPHDGCDALEYLCVGVAYLEPEDKLAVPEDRRARERYRKLWQLTGGVVADEDDGNDDEDDWLADRRNGVAVDE